MSIIHVNRSIYNSISNEDVKKEYIEDCIISAGYEEIVPLKSIIEGIYNVITENEKVISKYGMKKYIDYDYPAEEHVSGYYDCSGMYVICPFDWSVFNSDFDYSFFISKVVETNN